VRRYAVPFVLLAWSVSIALFHASSILWLALLVVAIVIQGVELAATYRDYGRWWR
jgi:hypothetical protein